MAPFKRRTQETPVRGFIRMRLRARNAVSAGTGAFLGLLSVTLWLAGPMEFLPLAWGLLPIFSGIALFAAIIGAFLTSARLRWGLLLGALLGLVGGAAIALYALWRI